MRLSTVFSQCDDKGSRIDVECPEVKWDDSEGDIVADFVTPSKAPMMTNLPLNRNPALGAYMRPDFIAIYYTKIIR